jgi:hypothetical protein
MDRLQWVRRHYAESAVALDPDAFVAGLGDDVEVSRGTMIITGREAVRRNVEQLRAGGLLSMRHDIGGLWEPEPGVVIVEATVTYHYKTHSTPVLPVVTVFRWQEDEVVSIRVYMDSARPAETAPSAD